MIWQADVLTAFPRMFPGALGFSNIGKALEKNLWSYRAHDLRNQATNNYASIDDSPFGGGPGMVITATVIGKTMDALLGDPVVSARPRIYLSPRGTPLDSTRAKQLAAGDGVVLLCGRYEGVDQRAIDHFAFEEISVGDYVISSGELAAIVLLDAVLRLLPEVVGASESLIEESFENHLLEYPQYTRPAEWRGRSVPEVLLSGDHGRIARWRLQQAEQLTRERRPDLWNRYTEQTQSQKSDRIMKD